LGYLAGEHQDLRECYEILDRLPITTDLSSEDRELLDLYIEDYPEWRGILEHVLPPDDLLLVHRVKLCEVGQVWL
jgi:hypothetical protein